MAAQFSHRCPRPGCAGARLARPLAVLPLAALLAAGCASAPSHMHYFAEGRAPDASVAWPPPPERPRLAYAGELIGEDNFYPEDGSRESAAIRLLRWVAGLGHRDADVLELLRPQSGTVDERGRILVTDAGRRAILVFDEAAGSLAAWEAAGPARSFVTPVGICSPGDGSFVVADAGLALLIRLDADGVPRGDIGSGSLERPTGLACDPARGEIYVADTGAHVIRVFAADGSSLRNLGGPGTGTGEFNGPTHLAWASDRLFVTDSLNARVQVFDSGGRHLETIGQRGLYVGNLVRPKGVTVDRDGHVYVVESYHDHLLVFDAAGRLLLPIGGPGSGAGEFFLPAGAWTDGGNRLFVADMFNGRIVVFDYLGNDR